MFVPARVGGGCHVSDAGRVHRQTRREAEQARAGSSQEGREGGSGGQLDHVSDSVKGDIHPDQSRAYRSLMGLRFHEKAACGKANARHHASIRTVDEVSVAEPGASSGPIAPATAPVLGSWSICGARAAMWLANRSANGSRQAGAYPSFPGLLRSMGFPPLAGAPALFLFRRIEGSGGRGGSYIQGKGGVPAPAGPADNAARANDVGLILGMNRGLSALSESGGVQ